MKRLAVVLVLVSLSVSLSIAGEVGFIEDFALAKDRAESLKQLIPGTEDYYYYHCLHFLQGEQFSEVEKLTRPWHEGFGQTARLTEIQTRHAFLTYDRDPLRSLNYLRDRLGLRFDHQRETLEAAPNLPVALDQNVFSRATLRAHSFTHWSNLDNFEDSALDWLAAESLDRDRRRNLLQRLARPDLTNLPQLVAADLAAEHSQGFGAFPIHAQMTLVQLQELLRLRPELHNQTNFVNIWLTKLQPGADEDWRNNPKLTQAYFERLWTFVSGLAPVHNSLKAHVLFHHLVLDRGQGLYDKNRFMEYLKLPRHLPYMAQKFLERQESRAHPAALDANYQPQTLLPAVGNDEPLVRSYLKHFLLNADSPREFETYINDIYLKHLFAETKIENGIGNPEQWASDLPPELFRQLKERVDIDFAYTSAPHYAADGAVKLDVFLKNVPTLIVKTFEINTANYYREHKQEVNTDINLDGLIPNDEQTYTLTDPPLRRITRRFEFPKLTKPGVYVIDFIGNGKSSRVLVRKGKLHPLVAVGPAGLEVTVLDEANRKVIDATLWLNGQDFKASPNGTILVPFSTQPGPQPVVISRGDFACLAYVNHQAESYALSAGLHVEREALLAQRVASLLVRPSVTLNGTPVSLKLLEEVKLRITSVDLDNIATSSEVADFKLFEDRDSVHEFRVPPRIASLSIELRAKVKSLSLNRLIDLAASAGVTLNGIDRTDRVEDLHLAKFGNNWVLELLGKTGEAKPERPIQLALKQRDFRQQVNATVKTDSKGRVNLGPLADITAVTATGPEGTSHAWPMPTDAHSYRQVVHAKAGEVVFLPYMGASATPSRAELALFELGGTGVITSDRFNAIHINNGMLELQGLAAGNYELWLKRSGEHIHIRVVDGVLQNGYVLGALRQLEMAGLKPVQIASISSDGEGVAIRLKDASQFARVHVFGTRYRPAYSAFADLAQIRDRELGGVYPARAESVYVTGRNIGDEFRYVLDRRLQTKYPGNMLERPQFLLNPWAVRSTETGEQQAQGGEDFAPKAPPAPSMQVPSLATSPAAPPVDTAGFANLDFLADAATVAFNLIPDKEGVIKLAKKDLGPHSMIHVIAVDPLSTTYRMATLAEQPASFLDLRLRTGLDSKEHFTQQKQVSVLEQGKPFVLADFVGSRFEAYDSLAKVYGLYMTLSKDAKLAEFSFILNWPKLKPEEKRKLYSQYACHELSFFLFKKDPEFFKTVIQPYLVNKKDKTFLDRWLLEADLKEDLDPWRFGRLNVTERILLAQRLPGEPARTSRHLNDLWRLMPPNLDRSLMLFDTAVKSSELESTTTLGVEKSRVLKETLQKLDSGSAPTGQPREGGAFGGGGGRGAKEVNAPEAPAAAGKVMMRARDGRTVTKDEKKAGDREEADKSRLADQLYFKNGLEARKSMGRQLYRRLDATMEYAENNYYKLLIQQQLADLVTVSPYWLDYAKQEGSNLFLSKNLADASRNFTEMMFALALLDLPFEAGKHEMKFEAGQMTFTPAGAVIAFHEEVKPATAAAAKVPVLVSQNFYRVGDRYREEGGEKIDKFVTEEFVIRTAYGCQVVVTNPTSSRQKLAILVQLPIGAIPLAGGKFTRTVMVDLEPYRTQTVDYLFYFPLPGKFAQFPAHIAKNEQYIASAPAFTFNVVEKPTKLDTESWDYVSQNGTTDQVLALLNRENVFALNLEKIAFRMKDKAFFEAVLALLRGRHAYQTTLWSYALFHNSLPELREYLRHADNLVAEVGNGTLVSAPLVIDAVARQLYEHLEYKPLVNARAHSLGRRRQIVNDRLNEQYHRFLKQLSYKKTLDDTDLLAVTYYLLLQDRIAQALETFARVDAAKVTTRLQYDYCAAYLAFFSDEPQRARAIAQKHANEPVDRWRNAFAAVASQLDEIEGKATQVSDAQDRNQQQTQAAAQEPSFDFTLDGSKIQLAWQNLKEVRINYYLMDVELLFSRNPFVQQYGGQFAAIRPNRVQGVELVAGQTKQSIPLPAELTNRNVLVEIVGGGKTRSLPYYANALDVRLQENYGQLRVTDAASGKAQPKVYVKVYARLADGQVKFYKDGYTDHRGRFDYASVSTPEVAPVQRLSILVLSEDKGAQIREVNPPQQ